MGIKTFTDKTVNVSFSLSLTRYLYLKLRETTFNFVTPV